MAKRKSRPVRTPLGRRMKTEIPVRRQEDGYVYRRVNDDPGRVDDFLEHGWELVDKEGDGVLEGGDLGSCMSVYVGTHADGSPKRGYEMRIRKDWHEEDQATKQAINDRVDLAIKGGVEAVENAYTPNQPEAKVTDDVAKTLQRR